MSRPKEAIEKRVIELEDGFEKLVYPFQKFVKHQTTSSALLLICTIAALIIANSPYADHYVAFFHTDFGFQLGELSFDMSLTHWINDGLMALFFFLLGIEIKREMLVGEINNVERFTPIACAALGGMVVPAVIFILLNQGTLFAKGWGIPMATDTAFAIGILAVIGKRIPAAAFSFLIALAIIDDLGAILVIAVFYSESTNIFYLGLSALLTCLLTLCNLVGIRRSSVYFSLGILVWVAMLNSGVHTTVAGILVAMTIPARPRQDADWFIDRGTKLLNGFRKMENSRPTGSPILGEDKQHAVIEKMQLATEQASTPIRRWEQAFEYPVALFIVPLFALANAGIPLEGISLNHIWNDTLALGIFLGLVLGKCLGIVLFTWLALRLGLGSLPERLNMHHVTGLGLLGGMGFTMSIFITNLGFENMPEALVSAKLSILIASLVTGIGGYLWLRFIATS